MNRRSGNDIRSGEDKRVTLVDAIGGTPLLALDRVASGIPGLRLFGKAEHLNPGGASKIGRRAR